MKNESNIFIWDNDIDLFYNLLKCFDSELGRKLYFLEGGTTDFVQVKVVIINIRIFYSLYVCKRLYVPYCISLLFSSSRFSCTYTSVLQKSQL